MESIKILFSQGFIIRAVLVGVMVSLCASLLGATLVLKRYSMIGDGLSHVGFGALSIALVLNLAPMQVAIPIVVIAAFLLLRLSEDGKVRGDSAIALISSSALAIGIIVTTLAGGSNIDVGDYMFGSIFAINKSDVIFSLVLSIVVIVLYVFFYNKIFAITFDETYAKATGVNVGFYKMLLALLTAVTIVIGMRIMGTLLISSLTVFPSLTAMRVSRKFKSVILLSSIISVICFILGIIVSFNWDLPAGASIVITNLGAFIIFATIEKITKRN